MKNTIRNWLPLLILAFSVLGCRFMSGNGDHEVVHAPTGVGTPQGDKITKNVGPAGGSLSSTDGRLTITVPPNAVSETLSISIQPITNNAGNGLGLAYRLGPGGHTFTTPLEIAFHYNDDDLEGTFPEALSVAFQDEQGAWHPQRSAKLDRSAKTLTVSTAHFSDWAFLSRLRLSPAKAILRPGESQVIVLVDCETRGFLDKFLSRPQNCGPPNWANDDAWKIQGPGTYESGGPATAIYHAPGKKPTPNFAWVLYPYEFEYWDESRSAMLTVTGEVGSRITIVDRGYRAVGQTADVSYSGVICNIEEPFTVTGSITNYRFDFKPSSRTAGTVDISMSTTMITGKGSGTYVVENLDGERPRLAVKANTTGTTPIGQQSGGGTIYIDLVPIDGSCVLGS